MHFARLRLSGFKSFVDPTDVTIEPGLTGVVGPNGCGKSNLVEALRWAMGENSARRMRGQEMDDVIFGGTTGRAARNLAEVTITLDNADRGAPGWDHADSIEITRRIERGTGSDYRINGKLVRARDVQLLFQDNASGPASPALVSQGRIAAMISARPAERRQVLEEAAGITGLHSRRHEAELRLRSADENLLRLDDVLVQLDAQLGGLRKQARQAVRYRTISEQIRQIEAVLLHLQWTEAVTVLAAARQAYDANERIVGERMIAATRGTTEQAEAAAALPPLRKTDADSAATLQRLLVSRETLEAEAGRLSQAILDTNRRLEQVKGDLVRERSLATDAAQALARLAEERERIDRQSAGEADAEAEARAAIDTQREVVDTLDGQLTALTEAAAGDEARRQSLLKRQRELEGRLLDLARRDEDARRQIALVEAELAGADGAEAAAAVLAEAEERLEATQEAVDIAEDRKQAADAALAAARDASQAAEGAATRLKAEADGLRAALGNSKPGDARAPILDLLRVDPGWEAALGAALGDEASVPADRSAPLHWAELPGYDSAAPLPEGAEALAGHVTAPAALARRLSHVGVVADAAAAEALLPALAPGQALVTRAGGRWRWDGLVARPGAPSPAAARLQQRNRLEQLEAQLETAADAAGSARRAMDTARQAAQTAQDTDRAARRSQQEAVAAIGRAREAQSKAAQAEAARRSRLAALTAQAERLSTDRDEAGREREDIAGEIEALPDGEAQRRAVSEIRSSLAEARSALGARQSGLERLQREAGGRRNRLRTIESEVQGWDSRARGSADRLAELEARLEEAHATLVELDAKPAEIAARRETLIGQIDTAERARRLAADALAVGEQRQDAADRALRAAESALAEAREGRVRGEAAVVAGQTAVDGLKIRIAERLDCEPEAVAALAGLDPDAPRPDAEEIARKLDRLSRERETIGPVNLRAEVEIVEIESQHTRLAAEKEDLTAAIAKLRQGIASLNREARERLVASFDVVDGHFRALFTRLFGGGKAHLALTDTEDPLEAGLEIYASPPGKKLQHLSLLSGGEQALTAAALIFAVFLTNPAPICVLDEVDAPLDDANVDRLCTLLSEMAESGRTRFLIITHHRMTMARVNRLYGVTMMERGVSQLVSVDLEQAIRHAQPHQRELAV
ncbi:chromosome segregation protein [Inquilinus ginsengisoli]|uniref:Chromosome partition protein Smc n=1 Tax=Inquilinus ginsengisoli TaxID=363840 RepID=A0ABU1JUU6_9PROT|nr:chromosome segregation protein SMC [Inquilinus ginsengisoli]MDR6292393.1 chromosome segregation protein [Inquilinus ginsengisoli]